MNRGYANKIVRDFEAYVYEDAMAGSGHPGLVEWHAERLAVARERMICRLLGLPLPKLRMPPEPEVEY
jgi:hypothetical protein